MVLLVGGALTMESKQPDTAQQDVLSGWKDIARYLGKGIRTVQRYERELSLPVRRFSGYRSGSVMATKSDLDSWVRLSATAQESFNRTTWAVQKYLSSEIAKGLRDREKLHAQMMALRKELRASVRNIRESVLNLRRQLNETRRHQDNIVSVIQGHSNVRTLLSNDGKHRKPN
jgi:hypothetical protein